MTAPRRTFSMVGYGSFCKNNPTIELKFLDRTFDFHKDYGKIKFKGKAMYRLYDQ